jgi:hypothetical protein
MLPRYADIINSICPASSAEFAQRFDKALISWQPNISEKTAQNHRTEIVGKLFGMFIHSQGKVYASARTLRLISDHDQPAFFKDFCFKLQFPDGMTSIKTTVDRIANKIKLRPCVYIIQFLALAVESRVTINSDDIGFYILNSLDVLKGNVHPKEVLRRVILDKNQGRIMRIVCEDRASSYTTQHVREILSYMCLANLIRIADGAITLNQLEVTSLGCFLSEPANHLQFDVYRYDLASGEQKNLFAEEWSFFNGQNSFDGKDSDLFRTPPAALISDAPLVNSDISKISSNDLGSEGERLVYMWERDRVKALNPLLARRVQLLSKSQGIGYDIQSIYAEGPNPNHAFFIEVKSTKRVTQPQGDISDSMMLTRNEWHAAEQYRENYFIYRIYFTSSGQYCWKIQNPYELHQKGKISVEPENFRIGFKSHPEGMSTFPRGA